MTTDNKLSNQETFSEILERVWLICNDYDIFLRTVKQQCKEAGIVVHEDTISEAWIQGWGEPPYGVTQWEI